MVWIPRIQEPKLKVISLVNDDPLLVVFPQPNHQFSCLIAEGFDVWRRHKKVRVSATLVSVRENTTHFVCSSALPSESLL
jgi:hypothetical protein